MSGRATPAVSIATDAGIRFTLHEFTAADGDETYGEQAAAAIGVPAERVFKTLIAQSDGGCLMAAIVPASHRLDVKSLATAARAKRVRLADQDAATRATGYVIGGISPLGQRRSLPTYIDDSAFRFATIFVSAGRRGLQMEITPHDIVALCNAVPASLTRGTGSG